LLICVIFLTKDHVLLSNFVFSVIVPSEFIGLFNATHYAFDYSTYAQHGTVAFAAQYIINTNVTLQYLSFDIMLTVIGEVDIVGEASGNDGFLINGAAPPIHVQSFNQSEYVLAITIGILPQNNDVGSSIMFDLLSNISTIDGMTSNPSASATLFITGELKLSVVHEVRAHLL